MIIEVIFSVSLLFKKVMKRRGGDGCLFKVIIIKCMAFRINFTVCNFYSFSFCGETSGSLLKRRGF